MLSLQLAMFSLQPADPAGGVEAWVARSFTASGRREVKCPLLNALDLLLGKARRYSGTSGAGISV